MNNRTNEPRKHCLTPLSLQGQILWRDFFYTVSAYTPNFTTMKGNPICLQISWDSNDDYLTRWTEGRTGYPWIDAIMRQLQREGWIHHLARHAVACFLTRGDLWLSWEAGQQVFEQHLLDADYSMNAGNWMWLSASAFYHHYNKMFHPVQFGKRLDPSGDFVRKYVKELESFPTKYIYDPWKAPLEIQKQARCIIGKDYPKPIINHYEATVKNLARMKAFRASQANTIKLTSDSFDYSTWRTEDGMSNVLDRFNLIQMSSTAYIPFDSLSTGGRRNFLFQSGAESLSHGSVNDIWTSDLPLTICYWLCRLVSSIVVVDRRNIMSLRTSVPIFFK